MLKKKILFASLLLIIVLSFPCLSLAWSGKIIGIANGDAITVLRVKEQVKIRLVWIDTPKRTQSFGTTAK